LAKREVLDRLAKAIIEGDEIGAKEASEEALVSGVDPLEAIKHGAAKSMKVVGEKFHNFEIFLPQVMLAADAMKVCMAVLVPKIAEEKRAEASLGKVVIGTVYGDIHDIGKNLVATLLSVAGFEVYDLGVDVPPKRFVEKAEEVKAAVIAMSSLLTTSLLYMSDVMKLLKDRDLRNRYYVIVGGGPTTPEWAERIEADGYGRYADDAAAVCKKLVTENEPPPLPKPCIVRGGKS
jgi:corrinoid protein of di/trimethylamine methyltransferase